jgi:hypothetical protein
MIRIGLIDSTAVVKHVDCRIVPATTAKDFARVPDGIFRLRAAVWLSKKLKAERISGKIGEYLWYRLKVAPAGKHKNRAGDRQ